MVRHNNERVQEEFSLAAVVEDGSLKQVLRVAPDSQLPSRHLSGQLAGLDGRAFCLISSRIEAQSRKE